MKSRLRITGLLFLAFLSCYCIYSAITIARIPSFLLIDYAINPEDLWSDHSVYFPGIGELLVWRVGVLDEGVKDNLVDDTAVTPYLILSLAYAYPEHNARKFKRAKAVLDILRESGLSLYKLDSSNCTSLSAAVHPQKSDVRGMNSIIREGHSRIAEHLMEIGDINKYHEADIRCDYSR